MRLIIFNEYDESFFGYSLGSQTISSGGFKAYLVLKQRRNKERLLLC